MKPMQSLTWSNSHAVFVTEIDDDHKEIFAALSEMSAVVAGGGEVAASTAVERLVRCLAGHFAHEERLMRAARYGSMRWHKSSHDHARRRVRQFVERIERGDSVAGEELVRYLTSWLDDHTRLADRMLGAFLRNHQRFTCKMTFRAGTRPGDSCSWVTLNGETLNPITGQRKA
jgi:hemerythrin